MARNPAKQKPARPAGSPIPALRVISSQEGFRRAGYAFGREPVDIPLDDLNDEQVQLLKTEAKLAVVEVELPPEPEPDAT